MVSLSLRAMGWSLPVSQAPQTDGEHSDLQQVILRNSQQYCSYSFPDHMIRSTSSTTLRMHRSAPLPIKVDGFSLGAVAGFSEQHSVISLGNDNDVGAFLKASILNSGTCPAVQPVQAVATATSLATRQDTNMDHALSMLVHQPACRVQTKAVASARDAAQAAHTTWRLLHAPRPPSHPYQQQCDHLHVIPDPLCHHALRLCMLCSRDAAQGVTAQ